MIRAEDAAHKLSSSRPYQAGDSQNLSLSYKEMIRVYLISPAHVSGFQNDISDGPFVLGIFVLQGPSYNHVHQFIHGDFI